MTQTPHLSIVIVPFNGQELLKKVLSSVFNSQTKYSFEVIVHDNGSTDGTPEMVADEFPQAKLIKGENIGFSAGNNAAIKEARGRYILLLNPDAEVKSDTIEVMLDLMERRTDIGIATCRVVLGSGELDPACRRSFPTPWVAIARLSGLSLLFPESPFFNKYNLSYLPEDEEYEIDSCSGAFLLIRRSVIDKVGLLDEDFFMYNEDVDWCYRTKQAGFKVYYYPKTTATHYKRQTAKFSARAQWEFHRSMSIFYKKHFAHKYPWFINQIAYHGPKLRYFFKLIWSRVASLGRSENFEKRF